MKTNHRTAFYRIGNLISVGKNALQDGRVSEGLVLQA